MTSTQPVAVHLSRYQARDIDIVDYQMSELEGTGMMFRGPLPPLDEPYFVCLGAAQTFGCFCEDPYPQIVSRAIDLPALNLGYGGAGPEFFLTQEALLPIINNARFVIVQAMSARSQSNSYYSCDGLEYVTLREGGQRMGAQAAFDTLARGPSHLPAKLPLPYRLRRKISDALVRTDPRLPALVAEIQDAWLESSFRLLSRIEVPTVLLWFSQRPPAYRQRYGTAVTTLGEFPHLVTQEMVNRLRSKVAAYVECVTSRGSPQPLISRFTGKATTVRLANDRADFGDVVWHKNMYYPSPEMHEDAAAATISALGTHSYLHRTRPPAHGPMPL